VRRANPGWPLHFIRSGFWLLCVVSPGWLTHDVSLHTACLACSMPPPLHPGMSTLGRFRGCQTASRHSCTGRRNRFCRFALSSLGVVVRGFLRCRSHRTGRLTRRWRQQCPRLLFAGRFRCQFGLVALLPFSPELWYCIAIRFGVRGWKWFQSAIALQRQSAIQLNHFSHCRI